jgi:hypothetical protein
MGMKCGQLIFSRTNIGPLKFTILAFMSIMICKHALTMLHVGCILFFQLHCLVTRIFMIVNLGINDVVALPCINLHEFLCPLQLRSLL